MYSESGQTGFLPFNERNPRQCDSVGGVVKREREITLQYEKGREDCPPLAPVNKSMRFWELEMENPRDFLEVNSSLDQTLNTWTLGLGYPLIHFSSPILTRLSF